jgi:hypothetical protein
MRLSEEEKKKIIEEYVEWRLRASGYKQVTNRMKILSFLHENRKNKYLAWLGS